MYFNNYYIFRRNTSLETLEHDYYDLTDGLKQKIATDESTSSVPISPNHDPVPYLIAIVNAQPPPSTPPPTPPKSSCADKLLLSENEISRAKTTAPKLLQVKSKPTQTQNKYKAKTLSPKPTNPCLEADHKQNSPFEIQSSDFLSESSHYQSPKIRKESDTGDKQGLLNKLATLSSIDSSKKRTSTFVSYLSEDNKENVTAVKPNLETAGSGGYKSLSRG